MRGWPHEQCGALQLAVMALTLVAAPAPQLLAQDWPRILGPGRNGIYTGPPIGSSFPGTWPPLIWKRDIGAGFAGPAVSAGQLVLFHRVNNRETVEAMDAATGKTVWTFGVAEGVPLHRQGAADWERCSSLSRTGRWPFLRSQRPPVERVRPATPVGRHFSAAVGNRGSHFSATLDQWQTFRPRSRTTPLTSWNSHS